VEWEPILHQSVGVKVQVVSQDPLEKGLRMLLNYGHTIGHALESYFLPSDSPLTHGEAIAIGMICETPPPEQDRVAKLIGTYFPKIYIPETAYPEIWQYMLQDKKNTSGTVRMAVPDVSPYAMRIMEITEPRLRKALLTYAAY
jgi:3-dehydroquinate synthase